MKETLLLLATVINSSQSIKLLEKHEEIDYKKLVFVASGLLGLGQKVKESKIHSPLQAIEICQAYERPPFLASEKNQKLKQSDINAYEFNFLFDAYIEGARTELYAPDLQTCKDKMVFGYKDYLYMGGFFSGKDQDFEPDFYNAGYNITATIGEMARWIDSCYETERDVEVGLIKDYAPQFESFGMYSLTWISNLLGRSLDITDRIEEIVEAEKICDLEQISYSYGRLTYYAIYVEPMPTASLMTNLGLTKQSDKAKLEHKRKLKKERKERKEKRALKSSKDKKHKDSLYYFHQKGYETLEDKFLSYKAMWPAGKRMKHFDYFDALQSAITGRPMKNDRILLKATPTFSDFMWMMGGFFNGTQVSTSTAGTACEETIVWSVNEYLRGVSGVSPWDPDNFFYGFTNLMFSTNPIWSNCWEAGIQAGILLEDYTQYYTRLLDYTDVFAYNFGSIYTGTEKLIQNWANGLFFNVGFDFGHLIYMTFFTYTGEIGS